MLGDVSPALTVVIVNTLMSKWLLEIEAIAASE
jgi:enamine deaminase RidA (YjgF/YER057c/UK114 family)